MLPLTTLVETNLLPDKLFRKVLRADDHCSTPTPPYREPNTTMGDTITGTYTMVVIPRWKRACLLPIFHWAQSEPCETNMDICTVWSPQLPIVHTSRFLRVV